MAQKPQTREERRKQQAAKTKKTKGKKANKGTFKKIFLTLIALGIIGMLTGIATFAFMIQDTPKLDESLLKDPISSKIYDKDKELVTEVGSQNRDYVAYEDIPKLVENAFLATEDVRFYKHNGIDVIRLGGAVIANITDGFGSEGASTITQQVVKNYFLGFEKTISRKAQEAWLAYQLEQKYTKQQIFEMYVNKIYMSENMHGVLTASKTYFGKDDLSELELHEAALLAGMPQSPNNYNPFTNPEKAEKRRNTVLYLMHQHGFISQEEKENAQKIPVESSLVKEENRNNKNEEPFDAFIDMVIEEVTEKTDFDIFSDGLEIYTTLDQSAQKHVESILNTDSAVQFPNDEMQAGITLLDTKTGEIRAIGGGRKQQVKRGLNYAIDVKRQPGSTIKPILDYGPAIEHLRWGTYHMLEDKPMTYSNGEPIGNWNDKYNGIMTMRMALAKSINIPALQAFQAVGDEKAREFGVNLGLTLKDPIFESASIGAHEIAPIEMAGAYAAFGNNGFFTEPYSVNKIVLRDKTEIDLAPETEVVMKDYTAFMISDMLKTAIKQGTGATYANISNLHVAGKTGTTNYTQDEINTWGINNGGVPDSWFVGYTTRYTASVWTGYNDRKTALYGTEQKISQMLFKDLMTYVSKDVDTPDFTVPKSVEKVKIEKGTMPAKLASEYTPKDEIIYEWAVKGNVPKETSKKFEKLETPSKLEAKYDETKNEILLSWEFNQENKEDIQFEVTASLDEGPEQTLTTTAETGLKIANAVPGGIYSFKVTAIRGEQRSDPATLKVEVPEPFLPEPEDGQKEKEEDEKDEGNENGQGNGTGTGNGNGNDPGNGDGEGNNNGNNNDDGDDD
ncbi:PBP1A family penicillin-binding protein [Mesobacillus subterraneus]|uniref:penicillin-binding protein 1A n=1 Tax=Mesobacillus subterraneus TaxID=285983 RepID=UPI001CFD5914|nr:penicillin-binding protein 1A [Mesobacillus subterraneus]WLR56580.1 PBP1A family penicillin-binding protein [Mesobacillus subterraneus]